MTRTVHQLLPVLARTCYRRPVLSALAILVPVMLLGLALPELDIRTAGSALYPQANVTVQWSTVDEHRFQDRQRVMVVLRDGTPPLESPPGFAWIEHVHQALTTLPSVNGEGVRSLADLLKAPAEHGSLHVHRYLENLPDEPAEFRRLTEELRSHPLTSGLFLAPASTDGRTAAAFYLPVEKGSTAGQVAREVEDWWTRARDSVPYRIQIAGPPLTEARLGEAVREDLFHLVPLVVVVLFIVLWLSLRSLTATCLLMVVVLAVLVSTLGAMAVSGVPLTLVTIILPVVLLAMTILDEIHLLERLQRYLQSAGPEDPASIVERTTAELQRPVVLTSLTTSVGFLSFLSASIEPIRHFGIFVALGIQVAMVFTFTLVPALLGMVPTAWLLPRRSRRQPRQLRIWRALAARPGLAFGFGVGLLAACLPGLRDLQVQDSWIGNLDPQSALVLAERDYNEHFWGSYRFDVVLEAADEGFFQRPMGFRSLEAVEDVARQAPHVRGVVSSLLPYRILAREWHEPLPLSALPATTLDDLSAWVRVLKYRIDHPQFVTEDGRHARLRLFVNSPDYRRGQQLWSYLDRRVPGALEGSGLSYHFSGDLAVAVEVVQAVVRNQLRSMALTVAGIGLLTLLLLGGPRSLVVMAPVCGTTLAVFGVMGLTGLPVGVATSMFAALTLGVGVDFALHVEHRYRWQRRYDGDHAETMLATLDSTGRALAWNATALAGGFAVLGASVLLPNRSLGLLLSGGVLLAYLSTLLLMPWLLAKIYRGS